MADSHPVGAAIATHHDGPNELAVLVLGGNEVTLGCLQGVGCFLKASRVVHGLVGDLLLGALHDGRQRRARHGGRKSVGSPLRARRADGLGRLSGSRCEARELARNE